MRRSTIAIMAEILEASSKEGVIQSDIMRHANLDSSLFKIYSRFLQKYHLLEKIGGSSITYKTTQKGYEFLGSFKPIQKMLGEKINL